MANSSFTKGTIETPVSPENGGTGLSTLGTAGQTQVVNQAGTSMEWGEAGAEGVDTYTASTNGYLTCGTAGSLANFNSLASGSNDGSISITFNGVEQTNIPIDIYNPTNTTAIDQSVFNSQGTDSTTSSKTGQIFTTGSNQTTITGIGLNQGAATGVTGTLYLRTGTTFGSGTLLASKAITIPIGESGHIFADVVTVTPSTQYHFYFIRSGGATLYARYQNTDVYAGGHCMLGDTVFTGYDLWFRIYEQSHLDFTTMSQVAPYIQSSIRATTGSIEAVSYDTDHFIVTSGQGGTESYVGSMGAGTSGTNMSSATYLNGVAGTTSYGTGNNGKVALLNNDGKIDGGLVADTYVSSETRTGTTALTMPATANKAYITCTMYRSAGNEVSGDLVVFRTGKTVAYIEGNVDGIAATNGRSFTLSGDTITVASIGLETGTASYTAYYYK